MQLWSQKCREIRPNGPKKSRKNSATLRSINSRPVEHFVSSSNPLTRRTHSTILDFTCFSTNIHQYKIHIFFIIYTYFRWFRFSLYNSDSSSFDSDRANLSKICSPATTFGLGTLWLYSIALVRGFCFSFWCRCDRLTNGKTFIF